MQELIDLVAVTLGVGSHQLTENSNAGDFPKWDSLRIVLLGSMIEQTYGLTLSSEEISSLNSMTSVISTVRRHGVEL
jgi:acyl carrier protein